MEGCGGQFQRRAPIPSHQGGQEGVWATIKPGSLLNQSLEYKEGGVARYLI